MSGGNKLARPHLGHKNVHFTPINLCNRERPIKCWRICVGSLVRAFDLWHINRSINYELLFILKNWNLLLKFLECKLI